MNNEVKAKEGFLKAEYEIEAPGLNKGNTIIHIDTEESLIQIGMKRNEKEATNIQISIPTRYDLKETVANIVDGIISIKVPTKEGVVQTVEIE